MKNIIIPDGWTYFVHRTNTAKWDTNPFTSETIKLNKLMSTKTENDVLDEVKHFGRKNIVGYSNGQGEPFEIRTLICSLNYLKNVEEDLKNIMYNEFYFDRMNLGGARGQRHPSMPKGEELFVLGYGNYDPEHGCERKIIWTIPSRFLSFYKNEIEKDNNRYVGLNVLTDNKVIK